MYMFYDPLGNKFDTVEDFITFYNKCYYLSNSSIAENEIEKLFEKSSFNTDDVMLILRWKLGRIDFYESERCESVRYKTKDQKAVDNSTNCFVTYTEYGNRVEAEELCRVVIEERRSYFSQGTSHKSVQDILNSLNDTNTANIGTVYLITLLYFITGAEFPIYDRFAMKALTAISKGTLPGKGVPKTELPGKKSKEFKKLLNDEDNCDSEYMNYMNLLAKVFKENYTKNKKNRDIDRALWVYGHLFGDKE